ncbi:MAG TPA: tetratricopeptide repeat protein [Verrucomicrobiae bacterium]|nr:tetratricopeptide repeat protein [Verrucomicrobiae bacterium]
MRLTFTPGMRSWMFIPLLASAAVSLSTWLQPWFERWSGNRSRSSDILTVALGDSRRLFARHFYVKADAYFHSGYYPTIFDNHSEGGKLHIASSQSGHSHHEGDDFLGQPKDWLDRFSRHFYPSHHSHLGDPHEGHDEHDGDKDDAHGDARELLPWLNLAAELDPQRPETFVVTSYWLRAHLGNPEQAEQFLRQGLQANPGHYEILFELGRIYRENRNDPTRARNVWELALKNWRERQAAHEEPEPFVYEEILGQLAKLEEEQKDYAQAIRYLQELKLISPSKPFIEKWIGELKEKSKGAAH